MADFGELVLVLGDLHIPHRKEDIPQLFKDLLVTLSIFAHMLSFVFSHFSLHQVPGKMQHILCTGNECRGSVFDVYFGFASTTTGNVCSKSMDDYLRTLANSVHVVRGDMDNASGLRS